MTIRRKRRSIVATVVYEHRAYAPIVHLFVSISLARQQSRLRISFSLSGTSRVCLPADILPIYCRKSSVNHFPDITPDQFLFYPLFYIASPPHPSHFFHTRYFSNTKILLCSCTLKITAHRLVESTI